MHAPVAQTAKPKAAPAAKPKAARAVAAAPAQKLQRSIGNQAVLRLQAKLVVGDSGDPLERDADRAAARVLAMDDPRRAEQRDELAADPSKAVRRKCACATCATCTDEPVRRRAAPHELHVTAGDAAPATVDAALASGGEALDAATRAYFEPRFGHAFAGVRVHNDALADTSARAVGAVAYTVGEHVVFRAGAFAPGTREGKQLLAHELAHVVQQTTAVAPRVQREDAPLVATQIEQDLEFLSNFDSPTTRPFAIRVMMLLSREHPRLETQADHDAFLDACRATARSETATLAALGASRELVLDTEPGGFPDTWAARVHAALTLNVDRVELVEDVTRARTTLERAGAALPADLYYWGLPVPLDQLGSLHHFALQFAHLRLPAGSVVGEYARETARYAQVAYFRAFQLVWEGVVDNVTDAVREGRYVPRYADYVAFTRDRAAVLRDLPDRLRRRLATSEDDLNAIQRETVELGDAALVASLMSSIGGIVGIAAGWTLGMQLFDEAVLTTDARIAASNGVQRFGIALRWTWASSYVSATTAAALQGMWDHGLEMLGGLLALLVLQLIPGVDVAVDLYLLYELGAHVVETLVELRAAVAEVQAAASMVAMQRAVGRLARVLTAGAIEIITALVAHGLSSSVGALRGRAARLRAAEAGLTEEEALQRAARQGTAAERAPLDRARGLAEAERSYSADTRQILDTPGVRQALGRLSARTRRILERCNTPCLPPAHDLLAADLQRLDAIFDRIGVAGEHDALREFFYRRRGTLVEAIQHLDESVATAGRLDSFLEVANRTVLRPGEAIFRRGGTRWVFRRADGLEVLEYGSLRYRAARGSGSRGFFEAHHGAQGAWAEAAGIPGYNYRAAPTTWLRDSVSGTPHRIISDLQAGRLSSAAGRPYSTERAFIATDFQAAGASQSIIDEVVAANDVYFTELYTDAVANGATPTQLTGWFGTWRPPP